jgi:hypothetical protein
MWDSENTPKRVMAYMKAQLSFNKGLNCEAMSLFAGSWMLVLGI